MKIIAKLNKIALLAIIALATFSCNNDDEPILNPTPVDNSIAGIASRDANLSTLVQALTKTGLASTVSGSGSLTVFAPTNTAFSAFLTANNFANLDAVPVAVLKEILLNHVIDGAKPSTLLVDQSYIKTLATGTASTSNKLSMFVDKTSGVKLNGVATVTTANILATNGVIHVVNAVIGLPTVVTHALANPNFTSLVGALTGAGQPNFPQILSETGPFTVFAPTNAAFTSLNAELAAGGITPTTAQLTSVLQYHVVSGNILSTNPALIAGPITTLNTQTFTVSLTGGAKITDKNNRVSNIVATDVQCANGVIHVLDKVLLPTL